MEKYFKRVKHWVSTACLVSLLSAGLFTPGPASTVSATASTGSIAYVVDDDANGDEIWLIEPDGTGNRQIWKSGVVNAELIPQVKELSWNPEATQLAFSSQHEAACSFYENDIYTIYPDGTGYRRVTAPPACADRAGMSTGTVVVSFYNNSGTIGPFVVYIQGGDPQLLTLPSGSSTVTFTGVADYGAKPQWATAIYGVYRFSSVTGQADVLPGQTVHTAGPITISAFGGFENWGWRWPTWHLDGTQLAFVLDASSHIYGVASNNANPGESGVELLNVEPGDMPGSTAFLAYGPVPARSNQLLYAAYEFLGNGYGIFLVDEGSSTPGVNILDIGEGIGQVVLGLAWLPDGSGFLYSSTEDFNDRGNLFEYRFATNSSTRLTDFASGYTRMVSPSPDGQQIVFELQTSGDWFFPDEPIELWMLTRGSSPERLVQNGRSPAWSPVEPAVPTEPESSILYLPMVVGR